MDPINLKELYGKHYKIGLDPAAKHEKGGSGDPWYFMILCRRGNIYPYSDKLLGFYCTKGKTRNRLHDEHPEIQVHNWADDGEAIFLFPVELFNLIAKYAQPRTKRILSAEHRKKLTEAGTKALRKYKNINSKLDLGLRESTNAERAV